MKRLKFNPVPGQIYRHRSSGEYRCLRVLNEPCLAIMQNIAIGWILQTHGCGVYPDGTIDWDYSTGGYFAKGAQCDGCLRKRVDLCVPCAAMLKEGYSLTRIGGGVDNKITCAHCGRRRYGDTYELIPKKAEKGGGL